MKIVFVNSCAYLGGAELWQLRTARSFRERGHQVAMLLRPGPEADRAAELGLATTTIPLAHDLDLGAARAAFRFLKKHRPDLILMNDQRETRLVAPAALLAGVKLRVQRKGWPFLKGSWRDRLVYRHFVTHLIANSKRTAQLFLEKAILPPERVRVIGNGMDLARFAAAAGARAGFRAAHGLPETPLIGALGRLVTQKGYDRLIEALSLLKAQGLEPACVVAGEGPERERLEAAVRARGLAWPRFIGRVDDVPALLAAIDVFVFPSRMEGRSNALAEAMAAGRPIVASDIPGNDELVTHGQTGRLVPPEDPAALAQALAELLQDPARAARLGHAARSWAEQNLDETKLLDELETYLVQLTRGS